jgi:DNA-binding NarL/FixJ family response regulator
MSSDDAQARTVLLVDEQPLRREAYRGMLADWSRERNLILRPEDFGTLRASAKDAALIILSVGSMTIGELQLQASLKDADMKRTPLVVISDRHEAKQIMEAMGLGIRGYLPTTLSLELALRTLTFILNGGDFFPPSALTPETAAANPKRRWDLLD